MAASTSPVSFVGIFRVEAHIGVQVLECLHYADVQRLACTNPELRRIVVQRHPDVVRWLRDVQVLRCLQCPAALLAKMSTAIRNGQYRIMQYEQGGQDRPEAAPEPTLFEAIENNWGHRFFGGVAVPFLFATVHRLDLEERELEVGEAFDDVGIRRGDDDDSEGEDEDDDDDDEDSDGNRAGGEDERNDADNEGVSDGEQDDRPPVKRRRRMLECCSIFCEHNAVTRVYYVHENPYCGACLDRDCFLKLCFCAEHYRADNSSWRVWEPFPYKDNKEYDAFWGLADDEFWAQLWYTAPYNEGEWRFVGTGPRRRS